MPIVHGTSTMGCPILAKVVDEIWWHFGLKWHNRSCFTICANGDWVLEKWWARLVQLLDETGGILTHLTQLRLCQNVTFWPSCVAKLLGKLLGSSWWILVTLWGTMTQPRLCKRVTNCPCECRSKACKPSWAFFMKSTSILSRSNTTAIVSA